MKFCKKCGAFMEKTSDGFLCTQCGINIPSRIVEVQEIKNRNSDHVYIIKDSNTESIKSTDPCPECGSSETFRRISASSGDHAGVKQERIVEHYRCGKCHHSWHKS